MKSYLLLSLIPLLFLVPNVVNAERDCPEDRICAYPDDLLQYRVDSIDNYPSGKTDTMYLDEVTINFGDYSGRNLIKVTEENSHFDPENYSLNVIDGQMDKVISESWKRKFLYMITIPIQIGDPLHSTNEEDVPIFEYETTYKFKNQDRVVLVATNDLGFIGTSEYIIDKKTGLLLESNTIIKMPDKTGTISTKLIDTNIIEESNLILDKSQPQEIVKSIQKIPDWVKNIFGWYANDQVSEDEMISALQFLIKEGIIKVD